MNVVVCLAAILAACLASDPKHTPPEVRVYSRDPGLYGKENVLICRASNFHPPDITIQLLKEDEVFPNVNQTDLAFKADWRFHLTTSGKFTPVSGEKYYCKVTHGTNVNTYLWEPNM